VQRWVIVINGFVRSLSAALLLTVSIAQTAGAETIKGALAKAYENNSSINSARAGVRVTDEGVAIAKSGYRPTVTGTGTANYSSTAGRQVTTDSFGITVSQPIFDGFRTRNIVAGAEAQVLAQRENLRFTEQSTLFKAASAYMDVIRDRQISVFRKKNLSFLQEQVRAANARFEVGEGTRTDVAQAQAGRSASLAQANAAEAQAKASAATYRQIIGEEPGKLAAAGALKKLLPRSLDQALEIAAGGHPSILANLHGVDATEFGVKAAEGALLPTLGAQATVSRNYSNTEPSNFLSQNGTRNSASVGLQLNVPLYQGGKEYATVRQQKEQLGKARIDVDVARDQVRAAVTSAWTQMLAAEAAVEANRQLVAAAQLALDGVVEERKVGQRTTLDVLNAQNDVTSGRINLATSEHDVVVASYAVLQATGGLTVSRLGLGVAEHKPEEHYKAVKDKWFGLRTPDGR
jgi:outer membrane protein